MSQGGVEGQAEDTTKNGNLWTNSMLVCMLCLSTLEVLFFVAMRRSCPKITSCTYTRTKGTKAAREKQNSRGR